MLITAGIIVRSPAVENHRLKESSSPSDLSDLRIQHCCGIKRESESGIKIGGIWRRFICCLL